MKKITFRFIIRLLKPEAVQTFMKLKKKLHFHIHTQFSIPLLKKNMTEIENDNIFQRTVTYMIPSVGRQANLASCLTEYINQIKYIYIVMYELTLFSWGKQN